MNGRALVQPTSLPSIGTLQDLWALELRWADRIVDFKHNVTEIRRQDSMPVQGSISIDGFVNSIE